MTESPQPAQSWIGASKPLSRYSRAPLSLNAEGARSYTARVNRNLVGSGDGLRARGGVHHGSDRGEIMMRPTELSKSDFAAVDADADGDLPLLGGSRLSDGVAPCLPTLLDRAGGKHRLSWMILAADREVEDRHDGVAHRLVEQAVMLPDRLGAFVIEGVEHLRNGARRLGLRKAGIAAQVGEQDGRVDRHLPRLHHPREHHLADRAGVRIHPARPNAESAKRRRCDAPEWNSGDASAASTPGKSSLAQPPCAGPSSSPDAMYSLCAAESSAPLPNAPGLVIASRRRSHPCRRARGMDCFGPAGLAMTTKGRPSLRAEGEAIYAAWREAWSASALRASQRVRGPDLTILPP